MKKIYKIESIFDKLGNVCERGKHRVGRKGFFHRLIVGESFLFISEDIGRVLESSRVLEINELEDKLEVKTRNSTYIFKEEE